MGALLSTEVIFPLIFATGAIAGTVKGGYNAATQQEKVNKEAAQYTEETKKYVAASKQLAGEIKVEISKEKNMIDGLYINMAQSAVRLSYEQEEFKKTYNHMVLIVVGVIVGVFLLLMLKKLGLLTLHPFKKKANNSGSQKVK